MITDLRPPPQETEAAFARDVDELTRRGFIGGVGGSGHGAGRGRLRFVAEGTSGGVLAEYAGGGYRAVKTGHIYPIGWADFSTYRWAQTAISDFPQILDQYKGNS